MRIILPGDDALLDERERAALHRIARERSATACPWLRDRCEQWIRELVGRNDAREVRLRHRLGWPERPSRFADGPVRRGSGGRDPPAIVRCPGPRRRPFDRITGHSSPPLASRPPVP